MTPPPVKRLTALLVILLVCAGLFLVLRRSGNRFGRNSMPPAASETERFLSQLWALQAREDQVDRTVWAKERSAERYGAVFDSLWDHLNEATNKFERLASFSLGQIVVGKFTAPKQLGHGIELREPGGVGATWSQDQWRAFLEDSARAGWQLEHVEFRQRSFETGPTGEPKQSRFYFRADVANASEKDRATLEGDILVDWLPNRPAVQRIDASQVTIRRRRGDPPFRPILVETIQPPEKWTFIDPLILYDLDGDGFSEIILPSSNRLYHRRGGERYEAEPLFKYPPGLVFTAVVADFDGDGLADLLCATKEGLFLFKGSPKGTFDEPGSLVWAANPPLKYGQFLTCGDIDGDGDLDVFLGQYKSPYYHGQMPTPYYDANDGDLAYLLLNDGRGHFTDVTESSGLGAKRWRRSYSGSFVRLGEDESLDLVVVSDFAGLDIYRNDGRGHFTNVTREWVPDPVGFGMAHALADFNADGRLDLLMIGMGSPTVDRLEHLGLWRSDVTEDHTMRRRLVAGNRLLLARPEGGLEQTGLNDSIAHSGWSWGCCAFDFDNDGFPDVFIANGHESKKSVREYEPEYWLHDIYVGHSQNDPVAMTYFQNKYTLTRGQGQSYGGYEIKRLYLNRGGASFFEAGYLMGVALQEDCRNVVADDLDGDGRMDLLVTTFEVSPQPKQTLRVYRNTLDDAGNWIGFRFREQGGGKSPVGVRVTLHFDGHSAVGAIVTGDSYRSQSANTLHFGLGKTTRVDRAEIVWVNGARLVVDAPGVNRYHLVLTPK